MPIPSFVVFLNEPKPSILGRCAMSTRCEMCARVQPCPRPNFALPRAALWAARGSRRRTNVASKFKNLEISIWQRPNPRGRRFFPFFPFFFPLFLSFCARAKPNCRSTTPYACVRACGRRRIDRGRCSRSRVTSPYSRFPSWAAAFTLLFKLKKSCQIFHSLDTIMSFFMKMFFLLTFSTLKSGTFSTLQVEHEVAEKNFLNIF